VNPHGAVAAVSFQFGTTTAYGQSTPEQILPVGNAPAAFSAALSGLPAATTIHYRAIARTDFGTFTGADQTLTTPSAIGTASVGQAKAFGPTVAVPVSCASPELSSLIRVQVVWSESKALI